LFNLEAWFCALVCNFFLETHI